MSLCCPQARFVVIPRNAFYAGVTPTLIPLGRLKAWTRGMKHTAQTKHCTNMTSKKPNRTQRVLGHTTRQGLFQIAVRLDPKTFAALKHRAVKSNMSLAGKLRQYIDNGLRGEAYPDEFYKDYTELKNS